MLVSVHFPITDLRAALIPGFARLARPQWPFPDLENAHVRGIGGVQLRFKRGFEGWVGEDRLAIGVSGIALDLPRFTATPPVARLRLIRKAGFFDGLLNGRIELLVGAEGAPEGRAWAIALIEELLNRPARVRIGKQRAEGRLRDIAPDIARLWAEGTVRHGDPVHPGQVKVGRPITIVESPSSLADNGLRSDEALNAGPNIELTLLRGKRPTETMLIWPGAGAAAADFRSQARHVRTYCLRLLQNAEGLSLLFSQNTLDINDDRIQNIINEYTRQMNRSRLNLQPYLAVKTIEYCYSAFSRIYPGRTDALRAQVQGANIRPNVARKVLALLEMSESSSIVVNGDFNMEKVMGDKFENISNSTIVNRSNLSNAMNAVGASHGEDVAKVIAEVADLVETSGNVAAGGLLDKFTEEVAKPEPNKGVVEQLWDGLVAIVPGVSAVAGAAAAIAKLLV